MTQEQLKRIAEDPKAFLERGKKLSVHIDARISAKSARIQEWRRRAESITAELKDDGGTSGGGPSKLVETAVCNIVDLENEIRFELQELSDARQEAETAINEFVEDMSQKAVLELRYLNDYTWEVIACRLHFAERWVRRLHGTALEVMRQEALSSPCTD